MKAIVQDKYGSPDDVLELQEIDKPMVKDDEVLVRVRAAGLHIGDSFGVRGAPFAMRISTGLLKPKHGPGYDMAGKVEVVGDSVKQFQPGMRCSARAPEPAPSMRASGQTLLR